MFFFGVVAGSFAVGLGRYGLQLVTDVADNENGTAVLIDIVWRALFMVGVGWGIHSIFRRRQTGRWLGIIAIVVLAGISVFKNDAHYASDAERFGANLARFGIMPILMLWWGYAFGFSSKARLYWN